MFIENLKRTASNPRLLAGVLFFTMCTAAGCNGSREHGKYTSEHKAQAQERMSMLKSGTEWQMAHQQFLAGELDKSLKTIEKSLTLNPKVAKSHVLKGRILIEKGKLEAARESLLTAEELQADNVEAQYYLGIVHEQFSQPEEALARYQKAADLDTSNPQYVIAAAEMLMKLNRVDEAEQLLTSRKQNYEYNAAVRQTLGHVAMMRNDLKAAAQHFNEALLLAPDDAAILEDLAQAELKRGGYAEAEFALAQLCEKEPAKDRIDLKQMRAKCLLAMNRAVEARTLLLEIVEDKQGSRDFSVWTDLGNVSAVLKDKPHLRLSGMRAVALEPNRHEGYALKAIYNRMEGRPEDALANLNDAVERCGSDTGPYVLKALVLQDLGRPFEAKQTLETALGLNPENARAKTLLASIDRQLGTNGAAPTVTGVPTE